MEGDMGPKFKKGDALKKCNGLTVHLGKQPSLLPTFQGREGRLPCILNKSPQRCVQKSPRQLIGRNTPLKKTN